MISSYTCTNFKTEEENKKYIKDNIMHHHDTLPMGEFAIEQTRLRIEWQECTILQQNFQFLSQRRQDTFCSWGYLL